MKINDFLSSLEEEARNNMFPIIGSAKAKILKDLIRKYKPKIVLEIGTLRGYSAIVIASGIDGKLTTIEIDERSAEIARENIENTGLSDKVNVITGDALDVIPELDNGFNFVFLDANKEHYLKYLKLIEPNLEENAVIVADNVRIFSKDVEDYLSYVKNNYDSETVEVPEVNDAMEISIRK